MSAPTNRDNRVQHLTRRHILIAAAAAAIPLRASASARPPEGNAWAARMAEHSVAGMSVTIVDQGRIADRYAFGVPCRGERPVVQRRTRFQAASVSKPVSAYGAMLLVDRGLLSLDAPLLKHVRGWTPKTHHEAWQAITLRQVMTHSAGLTVHGFGGYERGQPLPTLAQILDGAAPANSPPVEPTLPKGQYSYSGGGFVLMQLAMEDVTGQPFDRLMADLVLRPLGMHDSSFVPPAGDARDVACGHDKAGQMIAGRSHLYPERAAAGLWTTPDDLARFVIAVSNGAVGARMTEPAAAPGRNASSRTGLSLALSLAGGPRVFSHGGANAGFRCMMVGLPDTHQGIVAMTNGDDGGAVYRDIIRAVAIERGWPEQALARL